MRESNDPRYDEEKRTRAAALYEEHQSVRKVAEELGVSVRRAWELLSDSGVKMRAPGRPRGERNEDA